MVVRRGGRNVPDISRIVRNRGPPSSLPPRPGLAILVVEEGVGGVAVGDALGLAVPGEAGLGGQGEVAQEGVGGRTVAFLDVAVGRLPRLDAIEEVAGVGLVEFLVAVVIGDDLGLATRAPVLEPA